jgi:HSP20 family protein
MEQTLPKTQDSWFALEDGRLAIDIYEDKDEYVLTTAIAGLHPDDLEVFANHDMLTIRGVRHEPHEKSRGKYIIQECHWGTFSRSIILPTEIDTDHVIASLKNGILTVHVTKRESGKKIPVRTSV